MTRRERLHSLIRELHERWLEWTAWTAPPQYWSFLSLRTITLSYGAGAIVGWWVSGGLGSTFGAIVAGIVGTIIYVVAAVHPRNVTTCPDCGWYVAPRASACQACNADLSYLWTLTRDS